MGWERDLPAFRDNTVETPEVERVLAKSEPLKAATSPFLNLAIGLRAVMQ
jgi:hypothetical protein